MPLSGHLTKDAEHPLWVVPGLLVNSYLKSVPRSHYGGKAVVKQMGIITPVIITVLPGTATMRHSRSSSHEGLSSSKTGPLPQCEIDTGRARNHVRA